MKQKKQKQPLSKTFKKIATNKVLYIMLVPCMIYTFIFSYYPLTGWIMAFENYKPAKGYWGSKFVGFDQFRFLFEDIEFWRSMRNTLAMSVMNLIFSFLFAIVFALLLNEIKSLPLKKITQTVSYLPHFLSWIIVCSLISKMLSTNDGAVNNVLMKLGLIKEPLLFLGDQKYFWWILHLLISGRKLDGIRSFTQQQLPEQISLFMRQRSLMVQDVSARCGMSHFQESSPPLSYC